jgi:hypothetical protein
MLRTGCGHELPARASRGRPARFHNAACRQRAHRARHASRHHDALAALTALEAAASELRRTLLTGSDTTEAGSRLVASATTVHALLPDAATPARAPDAELVTESVTKAAIESPAPEPSAPVALTRQRSAIRPPSAGSGLSRNASRKRIGPRPST